ncbi:MAG: substrate-binding domain-containing protein, partial [Phormidesmis sp.]
MVTRKTASALTMAALLAWAVPAKSAAFLTTAVINQRVGQTISQIPPNFPVPESVDDGTQLRVSSGSTNMNAISKALGQGFQAEYSNATVEVVTKSADAAIQDVLNDNADLAAISRPLSAAEKEKGLIAVPVRREKIATVVG